MSYFEPSSPEIKVIPNTFVPERGGLTTDKLELLEGQEEGGIRGEIVIIIQSVSKILNDIESGATEVPGEGISVDKYGTIHVVRKFCRITRSDLCQILSRVYHGQGKNYKLGYRRHPLMADSKL